MIRGLPEKLKNLRIKHRYSQKQVAEILELSPSIISSYEKGERTPSVEVMLALSYLYRCSVDYLLGRKPEKEENKLNTDGLTDKQVQALKNLIETIKST